MVRHPTCMIISNQLGHTEGGWRDALCTPVLLGLLQGRLPKRLCPGRRARRQKHHCSLLILMHRSIPNLYRASVWPLSHCMCPCRVWSPAQWKMGATAAQNQFWSAVCALLVYSLWWNEWIFVRSTGFSPSMWSTKLGEPPPVSLLSWRRGGVVNVLYPHVCPLPWHF